jgi:hypothetical protein
MNAPGDLSPTKEASVHKFLLPHDRMTRVSDSFRHPDQAALVARLPFLGRSIPGRDYWRHQPVRPRRVVEHALSDARRSMRLATGAGAKRAKAGASLGGELAVLGLDRGRRAAAHEIERGRHAAAARIERGRRRTAEVIGGQPRSKPSLLRWLPPIAVGAAVGALAMYYGDPHQGRRRRALVRDKLTRTRRIFTRDVPHTLERRGRFLRGVATGVRHNAAELAHINGHRVPVDDDTLVARVRSEVLRDGQLKPGEIHLDAYHGCVTLRGQLEGLELIERVIEQTKHVPGVREVRSYLHLPGTPPPNKAEAYEAHPLPAPGMN